MEVLDLMKDPQQELEHLRKRQSFTGEPDAAMSCLSGSVGAGRKRTSVTG